MSSSALCKVWAGRAIRQTTARAAASECYGESGPELEISLVVLETIAFPWPQQRKHIGFVLKKIAESCGRLAQAARRTLSLGCSHRILSIFACNSTAIFFLASSKLLPWTVTDRRLQRPFQPSSSDQKIAVNGYASGDPEAHYGEVILTPVEGLALQVDPLGRRRQQVLLATKV